MRGGIVRPFFHRAMQKHSNFFFSFLLVFAHRRPLLAPAGVLSDAGAQRRHVVWLDARVPTLPAAPLHRSARPFMVPADRARMNLTITLELVQEDRPCVNKPQVRVSVCVCVCVRVYVWVPVCPCALFAEHVPVQIVLTLCVPCRAPRRPARTPATTATTRASGWPRSCRFGRTRAPPGWPPSATASPTWPAATNPRRSRPTPSRTVS